MEMAAGRRRDEWERTGALIHWIAATFAGHRVDPDDLNPVPRLAAVGPAGDPAAEAAEGWANLRAGFEQLAGQRAHNGGR
jgi:hypothetical protein